METSDIDDIVRSRLGRLSLEEKVSLLTGADLWSTRPIEHIGLGRIVMSDGPSGVRGELWDERHPSLSLPSASLLSSTWDPDLARRYGGVLAGEARRKGVHVVLGPTVNLQRSPYGGRHFEAFSEDPLLTGVIAAAMVTGIQDGGVGATLKHYVANEFETERLTADVTVDERVLREVYLAAFERPVRTARPWAVMSAYNSVNASRCTEHALLRTPLRTEWGFDGVVVSDWGAVRSLAAAHAGQDLVMPGPDSPWGDDLLAAVRAGTVAESVVDGKVENLLRLAARVGALDGVRRPLPPTATAEDGAAFAREAATRGMVLLRNDGILPLEPGELSSVAVIGQHAANGRCQGGGSATVIPSHVVSPLTGLSAALPRTRIDYQRGVAVIDGIIPLESGRLRNPATGRPGVRATFRDEHGAELYGEDRLSSELYWFGGDAPLAAATRLELTTSYAPEASGRVLLGYACVGAARIWLDGALVVDAVVESTSEHADVDFLFPPWTAAPVDLEADVPVDLRIEYDLTALSGSHATLRFTFGVAVEHTDDDRLIAEAARAARSADLAIVVVGTNAQVESEGRDRDTLSLPGRQDELVRAVAAANPRTVAVVNSGSPVLLPWRDEVAAVVCCYFGGQEMGGALADVLCGVVEPGGRLPTTWPATEADVPIGKVTPSHGIVRYDEGLHVGYRAWLRAGVEPAYPFGFGLGYTTWTVSDLSVSGTVGAGAGLRANVTVENTGSRRGRHVVQLYLEHISPGVTDRPVRWLAGFASVVADPGERVRSEIIVDDRAFERWDGFWRLEAGTYLLRAGSSVQDLPVSTTVEVDHEPGFSRQASEATALPGAPPDATPSAPL